MNYIVHLSVFFLNDIKIGVSFLKFIFFNIIPFFYLLWCIFISITVIECNYGTYGYSCANSYSGDCSIHSPCNKQTGNCDDGCKPEYTDTYCGKGNLNDVNILS